MLRHRRLRRSAALPATIVIAVSGCAQQATSYSASDQGTASDESTSQAHVPISVPTVESCSRLSAQGQGVQGKEETLPDIELPCLTRGAAVNLSELQGRAMVINLWATWCGPCREEMPILQEAREDYGDRVQFLGVDTKDDPVRAGAFLEEVGVTYPQVVDVDGLLLGSLRALGLPVTVVLAPDGRIAARHVGPLTADDIRALIEDAEA